MTNSRFAYYTVIVANSSDDWVNLLNAALQRDALLTPAETLAKADTDCADCQMGNHHLCDGELWTAPIPCACHARH